MARPGYTHSNERYELSVYPSGGSETSLGEPGSATLRAAACRLRQKVHGLLRRGNRNSIDGVIPDLDRLLIGWSDQPPRVRRTPFRVRVTPDRPFG
jgi:hypothetical protein